MLQNLVPNFGAINQAVERSGLLNATCTITVPPPSTANNVAGGPDPTVPWPELEGHVDLPCRVAPIRTGDMVAATEEKTEQYTMRQADKHLFLNGYYPLINETYRCTVNGDVQYDITNAEADSASRTTRLALRDASM